ncbi:hypothetical protein NLU13_5238 [Sarocladium strictum]|uniref:Uncharacterized protein n=1 Tax=Sarocladium strictum TaxID=5046 RepID=A0AA39GGI3_SARSR|nr:hypothetical protein NLU13_5238 [Sarocladium strictum]
MTKAHSRDADTVKDISERTPPAIPGTRHIFLSMLRMQYAGYPTIIEYLNVPDTYNLKSIKHASHVGGLCHFSNGETWLIINNKRVFRYPDYWIIEYERGDPRVEDWPIMSPKELKAALKKYKSLKQYETRLDAIFAEHRAILASSENEDPQDDGQTAGCCPMRELIKHIKGRRMF